MPKPKNRNQTAARSRVQMTHQLAMLLSRDAANDHMRRMGRTAWTEEEWDVAAAKYDELMPEGGERNPYLGDAVALAEYRRKRDEWERRGRKGPPPVPPRSREMAAAANPVLDERALFQRLLRGGL